MRPERASALLAAALLLGTCTPTDAPLASPTPRSTAFSAVVPGGFVGFRSAIAPYSICHPTGWRTERDWMTVWPGASDAFIGGTPGDLPQVAVVVNEAAPGRGTVRYLEVVLENLRRTGVGVERIGDAEVDGVTAEILRFSRLTADLQRYTVQQAVWAKDGRGWVLAVASAPAAADALLDVLRTMLGCFRSVSESS